VGHVLVNDAMTASNVLTIGGNLDVGQALTLSSHGNTVDGNLFVGGALTVSGSLSVEQNAVVYGKITGNVTIAGSLADAGGFPGGSSSGGSTSGGSTSGGSTSGGSTGGLACTPNGEPCTPSVTTCCPTLSCIAPGGGTYCLPDPPPLCNCSNPVDIAGIVANGASQNDNASIGLSESVFANTSTAMHLDLPCGEYYLTGIKSSAALSISVHGNTVLYVGGNIQTSGLLEITVDPTAQLSLFVGGSVSTSASTAFGSTEVPAQSSIYVGGAAGVTTSNTLAVAGALYVPSGPFKGSNATTVHGSLLANGLTGSGAITVHYDQGLQSAGASCPAP
jgi:hypothetical protein